MNIGIFFKKTWNTQKTKKKLEFWNIMSISSLSIFSIVKYSLHKVIFNPSEVRLRVNNQPSNWLFVPSYVSFSVHRRRQNELSVFKSMGVPGPKPSFFSGHQNEINKMVILYEYSWSVIVRDNWSHQPTHIELFWHLENMLRSMLKWFNGAVVLP